MDEGTVIMTGFLTKNIIDSIKIVTETSKGKIKTAMDYKSENVSERVVRILFSYVDYINRNVWKILVLGNKGMLGMFY